MDKKMQALVISDQPLAAMALEGVLRRCRPGIAVVEACHLAQAMTWLACRGPFDLVLLDIDMPESRRTSGAALLHRVWPDVPLAVVSATEPDEDVVRAIDAGAMGYLVMTADGDTFAEALRQILDGGLYLPEVSAERLDLSLAV